jgi:hypothetical protein
MFFTVLECLTELTILYLDYDCREALLKIDGVEYKFKDHVNYARNKRFVGYIAQQIGSVIPNAVQLIDGKYHVGAILNIVILISFIFRNSSC